MFAFIWERYPDPFPLPPSSPPNQALTIIEEVVEEVGIRNSRLALPSWALPEKFLSKNPDFPVNGETTREKVKGDSSANNPEARSDGVRSRGSRVDS
ncbi:hypothetical protein AAHC03_026632 [Spirometra sp. Aus1]